MNKRTSLVSFLLVLLFAAAADGLMEALEPIGFLAAGAVVVNAISKCRFSPKWDVVFYRAAYRCYTALYTTSLAGLKPVKP